MNNNLSIGAKLSVGEAVSLLSGAYVNLLISGAPARDFPSVMLWGAPGVGKSQGVKQIAKNIEKETGKRCIVTDVRLLLFNPIDLRGIPVANEDRTLAVWLKPKIFQMNPDPEVINILFLDEISAAPQSVQAAAYQITLDRVVGEHSLPDNCIVIAAGNRVTDKSVSFKMPKALANRLLHLDIEGEFESWRNWAVRNGINEKVIGFLSFSQKSLFGFDPSNDELAFATPRSWEMVSNILNNVNDDVKSMLPLISGLVGDSTAMQFLSWSKNNKELPDISDIFAGKIRSVPHSQDALFALVSAMSSYAAKHSDDRAAIGASIEYAAKLPADYAEMLLENYRNIRPGFEEMLKSMPEYIDYGRKRSTITNGYAGR